MVDRDWGGHLRRVRQARQPGARLAQGALLMLLAWRCQGGRMPCAAAKPAGPYLGAGPVAPPPLCASAFAARPAQTLAPGPGAGRRRGRQKTSRASGGQLRSGAPREPLVLVSALPSRAVPAGPDLAGGRARPYAGRGRWVLTLADELGPCCCTTTWGPHSPARRLHLSHCLGIALSLLALAELAWRWPRRRRPVAQRAPGPAPA
ncbi:MAG: hypothetical protein WKG07_12390 [Hymenobacter sp.]